MGIVQINELRAKRAALAADARKLFEERREGAEWKSAEDKAQFDRMFADVEKLADRIAEEERAAKLGDVQAPKGLPVETAKADAKPDAKAQLRSYLRGEVEARDLAANKGNKGGYLVAQEILSGEFLPLLSDMVWMRQLCRVIPVSGGASLSTASTDTRASDASWTAELSIASEDTTARIGKRTLTPQKLTKRILASNTLLAMSNAEQWVLSQIAEVNGRAEENAFLTGSGASQPLGIFTASTQGVSTSRDVSTGNTQTAIGADNLIEVKYKVAAQYRAGAIWLMHRDAVKSVALLADGNGQYLWRQGLAAGEPDSIAGHKVYESEFAPNTFTSGLYVGAFFNPSFYWIGDGMELGVQRLTELYAGTDEVGFLSRRYVDAMPVREEAFARVTLA